MADVRRLPRGRHDLTREQVEEDQRLRILVGFAGAMADDGYANTPVAAVLRHAGVSRETYYRLFTDKLDGFLAAFDLVSEVLVAELAQAVDGTGEPIDRAVRGVERYLSVIAAHRGEARLFLVEAYAAGPVAIERRTAVQRRIADEVEKLVGDFVKHRVLLQKFQRQAVDVESLDRHVPFGIDVFVKGAPGREPVQQLDAADLHQPVPLHRVEAGRFGIEDNFPQGSESSRRRRIRISAPL